MDTFTVDDPAALHALAAALGRVVQAGDVIGLSGDLGAGKTHFVRGLADGLGIAPAEVTSPTFTLIHDYAGGRVRLHHVDLYRLDDEAELQQIGLDEIYREGESVVAVEWFDRFPAAAPDDVLTVVIAIASATRRELRVAATGARSAALAAAWRGMSDPRAID